MGKRRDWLTLYSPVIAFAPVVQSSRPALRPPPLLCPDHHRRVEFRTVDGGSALSKTSSVLGRGILYLLKCCACGFGFWKGQKCACGLTGGSLRTSGVGGSLEACDHGMLALVSIVSRGSAQMFM